MQLDVSGMVCPQPVAIVRRCLVELEAGDRLIVTGDYPPAERTIRRTCYKHGYRVADRPADDGEFELVIESTEDGTLASDGQRPTARFD